jgi:hypothetical protein
VLLYGHLVVRAGLDGTPPDMLLGCLLEGARQLPEPSTRQRWHTLGAQTLAQQTRLQALIRRLWPDSGGAGVARPAVPASQRAGRPLPRRKSLQLLPLA